MGGAGSVAAPIWVGSAVYDERVGLNKKIGQIAATSCKGSAAAGSANSGRGKCGNSNLYSKRCGGPYRPPMLHDELSVDT
jgi:hypothetical protein